MVIRASQRAGALIGVAAVVAGLAAAQLVAVLKSGLNSPVVSLGNRVIDHVPATVKEYAIRTFGINDKSALVISILFVIMVFAAMIGRDLVTRNKKHVLWFIVVLVAIAGLASLLDAGARSGAQFEDKRPSVRDGFSLYLN